MSVNRLKTSLRRGRDGVGTDDSELERKFDFYWRSLAEGIDPPVGQYKFRRYRIDRAFPELKIAIELNGGAKGGGRVIHCQSCGSVIRARKKDGSSGNVLRVPYPSHSGVGSDRDATKSNALILDGWVLLTFTSNMIDDDPISVIGTIRKMIDIRKSQGIEPDKRDAFELSKREAEVLQLLADGRTAAAIGFQLGIATRTAEAYIAKVREKMGVSSSLAAVAKGVAAGLVSVRVS